MGYCILLVIAIIISIIYAVLEYEPVGWCIVAVIICWLFGLIPMALIAEMTSIDIGKPYEVKQYEIEGLQTNMNVSSNLSGHFILGFGSIHGETHENLTYYYFKKNKLGSTIESLKEENGISVYVREDNTQKPCLIDVNKKYKYNKFFRFMLTKKEQEYTDAKILIVPENTIKIEYNVDLK